MCVPVCIYICVCVCVYFNVVKHTSSIDWQNTQEDKRRQGRKGQRERQRDLKWEREGKREKERESKKWRHHCLADCRDSSLHATARASHAWHAPSQAYLAANYGQAHCAYDTLTHFDAQINYKCRVFVLLTCCCCCHCMRSFVVVVIYCCCCCCCWTHFG